MVERAELRGGCRDRSPVAASIVLRSFDTEAFEIPFYRIRDFNLVRLAGELPRVMAERPVIIDAKVPAHDVSMGAWLMQHGFRKVCTQVELMLPVRDAGKALAPDGAGRAPSGGASLADELALSNEEILAHAQNFTRDRFSQDPALPRAGVERLYAGWIRNSTRGWYPVFHLGRNFCTFSFEEPAVRIDLLSVLDKRNGVGSHLIRALVAHGRAIAADGIRVVTECENDAAWRLYRRAGFEPTGFISVFHYVATEGACATR